MIQLFFNVMSFWRKNREKIGIAFLRECNCVPKIDHDIYFREIRETFSQKLVYIAKSSYYV
jgi:hypothetical protein